MNIIGHRRIWYTISLLAIVPGIVSLWLWGLRLGIDFSSGQLLTVQGEAAQSVVDEAAAGFGFTDVTVVPSSGDQTQIRYRDPSEQKDHESNHQRFRDALAQRGLEELSFDSVGPTVSTSIAQSAVISLVLASLAIVLYIAFAFRNTPPPVSSWSFGFMAVAALLHDSLLLLGIFSLLGHFWSVEIDALFVTAVLTVIGFSVHDTIVVFDRIRENLRRRKGSFEQIVNDSILETVARSLNTSLTVILTLLALLLFGGHSIRMFVLALIIGIAAGTYSSIFNASPLLVTWFNYQQKRALRQAKAGRKR